MILLDILVVILIISRVFRFSTRFKGISFYINLICLTAITGSVYENINGDYSNYRRYFSKIDTIEKPDKELGFYYLNLIIKKFTDNFHITFIIFTLIVTFLVLKTIYKHCSYIEIGILVYVVMGGYITATNIMRQMIALALIFYAISFLLEKKYVIYIAFCIFAYTFHKSSLMPSTLIFLIFKSNKILYKNFIVYLIIASSIIVFEPLLSQYLTESVEDYSYANTVYDYGSSSLHFIFQFALLVFYYLGRKDSFKESTKLYINLTVLAFVFSVLGTKMVLYGRIATYFKVFNVMAIPDVVNGIGEIRERRLYFYVVFLALMIYFVGLSRKGIAHFDNYLLEFFNEMVIKK